jgi:hypothetical protein
VIVPCVAVNVWLPAVVRVALKVPTPALSGEAAGSVVLVLVSVLEKVTSPVKPVAVLLNRSSATTVNVRLLPATVVGGAVTTKCNSAVSAATTMVLLVPETIPWVAVRVWLPAVVKVALKVPAPLLSGLGFGNKVLVPASVLEKVTSPAKPVAVLLNWSSATTVKVTFSPASVVDGAETTKCKPTSVAVTVIMPLVPLIDPWVAVSVWSPAVVKVALKLPRPLCSGLAAGRVVWELVSVLEKVTLPVKPVAVLLN